MYHMMGDMNVGAAGVQEEDIIEDVDDDMWEDEPTIPYRRVEQHPMPKHMDAWF